MQNQQQKKTDCLEKRLSAEMRMSNFILERFITTWQKASGKIIPIVKMMLKNG